MGKIPPPFKRNSIDMDHHGRQWRQVKVVSLLPGDVVQGRGLVEEVYLREDNDSVEVEFWSRERHLYNFISEVTAFARPLTDDPK